MLNRKLLLRISALLAAGVASYFALRALVTNWAQAQEALLSANPLLLGVALVIGAAGTVLIGAAWGGILRYLAPTPKRRPAIAWYFMGEVAKYVPGSAWSVIGRGELAQRDGISRSLSYTSVLASLLLLYGTALVTGTITVFVPSVTDGTVSMLLVVILVATTIAFAHPRFGGALIVRLARSANLSKDLVAPGHPIALSLIVVYVAAWTLIGSATWVVATSLGVDASWYTVTCAATVSWLAGFVVVFAPGGIGIREAAFIAVSGLESGEGALVAVVARLLFVFIDVVGALAATIWVRFAVRGASRDDADTEFTGLSSDPCVHQPWPDVHQRQIE